MHLNLRNYIVVSSFTQRMQMQILWTLWSQRSMSQQETMLPSLANTVVQLTPCSGIDNIQDLELSSSYLSLRLVASQHLNFGFHLWLIKTTNTCIWASFQQNWKILQCITVHRCPQWQKTLQHCTKTWYHYHQTYRSDKKSKQMLMWSLHLNRVIMWKVIFIKIYKLNKTVYLWIWMSINNFWWNE